MDELPPSGMFLRGIARYTMGRIVFHERPYSVQEQHPFPFLREILLFLSLAGILIPLLQRLRINQVLGFLAVGALFGPFGLGRLAHDLPWLAWFTFPNNEDVAMLAELGVLFLMFMIGL